MSRRTSQVSASARQRGVVTRVATMLVSTSVVMVVAPNTRGLAAEPTQSIDVTVRGSSTQGFVSRVSADDRTREAVDAASMIAELPSVHVRRLGADGSQALLSIRGSASTQVGVVFAGIPLTSGADPSLDVGSLPLWPGATFRVYRGFAPASLGSTGYLGGMLVIDPPSPHAGSRTEWQTLGGSFGALKVRAGDTRSVGPLKIGVGVFGARSDNDFSFRVTDPITDKLVTAERTNAAYVSAGAVGRVSLERTWGSLGATLLADSRLTGLPGSITFPTLFSSLRSSRVVVGLDATGRTSTTSTLRAQLWGRRENTLFADPRGEIDPTRSALFTEQGVLAAGGSLGYRASPLRRLGLGVFLDARAERLDSFDDKILETTVAASRLALGFATEVEVRPSERLRFFGSGRLDGRRDRAEFLRDPSAPTAASDLVPSGHLGASYRFAEALVFAAHGGALRRFPSFVELYGDRGSLVGDPALRVESALSADAGVSGDLRDGRVVFHYEVVGFVTSARDLIVFLPLGRSAFRAQNVDRALLGGLELSASLSTRRLVTTLSYTLLGTENRSDDSLSFGHPLPGRPRHDFSYDASYLVGPLRLRYGVDAVAGTTVDTAATIVVPPRFFHGAGVALDVPRFPRLRLGVEVQNLFDVRSMRIPSPLSQSSVALPVSDFLGFPLPGRTFWASIRFRTL